jgi:hypothetical protein
VYSEYYTYSHSHINPAVPPSCRFARRPDEPDSPDHAEDAHNPDLGTSRIALASPASPASPRVPDRPLFGTNRIVAPQPSPWLARLRHLGSNCCLSSNLPVTRTSKDAGCCSLSKIRLRTNRGACLPVRLPACVQVAPSSPSSLGKRYTELRWFRSLYLDSRAEPSVLRASSLRPRLF